MATLELKKPKEEDIVEAVVVEGQTTKEEHWVIKKANGVLATAERKLKENSQYEITKRLVGEDQELLKQAKTADGALKNNCVRIMMAAVSSNLLTIFPGGDYVVSTMFGVKSSEKVERQLQNEMVQEFAVIYQCPISKDEIELITGEKERKDRKAEKYEKDEKKKTVTQKISEFVVDSILEEIPGMFPVTSSLIAATMELTRTYAVGMRAQRYMIEKKKHNGQIPTMEDWNATIRSMSGGYDEEIIKGYVKDSIIKVKENTEKKKKAVKDFSIGAATKAKDTAKAGFKKSKEFAMSKMKKKEKNSESQNSTSKKDI